MYERSLSSWCDVEINQSADMVVMLGEELSYLTKNELKAAVHKVEMDNTSSSEDRISLPFQLRGDINRYQETKSSLKLISISF